jgi:CheY-like chemotaxis protein
MKKYRIVIVENDEDEQMFMREGFEATGLFEILGMVRSGEDLFDWLALNHNDLPDIILSDLNMPGKNGYDILAEIRQYDLFAHLPVIITSTSSAKTIMDKCIALGASNYLVKPDTFIEYEAFAKNIYAFIEGNIVMKQHG